MFKMMATFALVLAGAQAAHAATYTFTGTFSDGGVLSGSVEGSDLDGNGRLQLNPFFGDTSAIPGGAGVGGEITAADFMYSGGSIVPDATYDLSDLTAFYYKLGGPLGSDPYDLLYLNLGFVPGEPFEIYVGNLAVAPGHAPCDGVIDCGFAFGVFTPSGSVISEAIFSGSGLAVTGPGSGMSGGSASPVPIPGGLPLLALGLAAFGAVRRRKS